VAPASFSEQPEDHMMGAMGWIVAVLLVALFLPLGAFLYLDILEAKNEAKRTLEKIEKIEKRLERKSHDKAPDTFDDNPIFDRLRRQDALPMSKPRKLG
jgi:di/tricarboxylate transporter